MHRYGWFLLSATLIAFDRLTKLWATCALSVGQPEGLIGQSVRLTLVHNQGGAFGIFQSRGDLFVIVSAIVAAVLAALLLIERGRRRLLSLGVAVLLAGAVGNLIDRFIHGYVVDFFEVRGFPVFNVADSCVTVGAILVVIYLVFGGTHDRSESKADRL